MLTRDLARQLALSVDGDPERDLHGAAPLDSAGPTQLSFVASRKAESSAQQSQAGCLLVAPDYAASPGQTVLRTPDPRGAFARALSLLYPAPRPAPGIHPTAVIAADAVLGPGVSIGPHVTVSAGARIGANCLIREGVSVGERASLGEHCNVFPRVVIYHDVAVGQRVTLHAGCVLGADGFGFAPVDGRWEKFPQVGTVEIGDDCEIGANACVDRAALGVTSIGEGTKLDNLVHIGHNCRIGRHVVIAAQTGLSGGVVVGDHAVIGGQVGIGDKARIEPGAVLGSGCGVLTSKVVRRGQVVWGTPARPLKEHLEQLASLARLPRWRREWAELKRKVDALHDRGGGRA